MHKIVPLMFITLLVILTGCGNQTSSEKNKDTKMTIYTTIYPIQFMAERIGGESVHAETIYPPGADAHTYEPTAKTMTTIAEGDAFIYLGAGLEAFAETAANALKNEDTHLIELGTHKELFAETANEEHEHHSHEEGHSHGGIDPHIWLDPLRAIEMASIIKDEMIEFSPEKEQQYTQNFEELKQDLEKLNAEFESKIASKKQKKILVSHAGYGYWEKRYGIEQIAITGLSSNSKPSQQDLIEIVETAKQYDLNHVIFEQNVSDNVSKQIQAEINGQALTIHNLAVRTEENIEQGEDYLSLMRQNIDALDKATN